MTSESLSLLRPTSIVVDAPPEPAVPDAVTEPAKRKMPSLPNPNLKLSRGAGSRGSTLVGLDIQPGYVSAVQARVNGSILVQRAAGAPLPADTVREGEVIDESALAETLREMFRDSRLDKRVRVGVANQRTVLRTLELPPITDGKELATAVRFQAEDQIPMPLDSAVLDFHALGVVDTPAGPRQRVIVVAAQRDMVERLLVAVRGAGLRPEAVDLSAFALIRSLHRADEEHAGRVLYLNVGGLTNMAIAEGTLCRFTRVVGGGLESIAADVAERHGIKLHEARELLASVDLDEAAPSPPSGSDESALEAGLDGDQSQAPVEQPAIDVRPALAGGVREIAGEVRNSLDFHRSQDGGGEVSSIVLSGPALEISGFAHALQKELRVPITPQTVGLLDEGSMGSVSAERLAVATGLAVAEAPR
ncbi:MAG TPA: type IV pilus assembly protein PilM [Solirubrobacteraceae bacterium]|jgi:type IV pilus assembly protein PilM|nr:type IV pilus assembly protein PilM [Solirubrobacteraceae bacterium]